MKKIVLIALSILSLLGCQQKTIQNIQNDTNKRNWTMSDFVKMDSLNPILKPSSGLSFVCPITKKQVKWEERNVLNPAAVVKDDKVYLFYRTQDLSGTSRIGLAISTDGTHFERNPSPVVFPDNDLMKSYEWDSQKTNGDPKATFFDGVEDPRIVESEDGTYIMTYTSYDGKTARLSLASSKDLKTWTKHGLVLNAPKYKETWSKSGAIVAKSIESRTVATKINGKYWMYFGDTNLFIAYSNDLIHWEIAENEEDKKMISVLHPRPGYFDSRLVEPGPFALLHDDGIWLIYNSSNAANFNDPSLPKFTYSAGQALFDKANPFKLIERTNTFFIHPDKDYEKVGEVNEVCFVEGLVHFKHKWFLYYGTADSKIAVAVREKR